MRFYINNKTPHMGSIISSRSSGIASVRDLSWTVAVTGDPGELSHSSSALSSVVFKMLIECTHSSQHSVVATVEGLWIPRKIGGFTTGDLTLWNTTQLWKRRLWNNMDDHIGHCVTPNKPGVEKHRGYRITLNKPGVGKHRPDDVTYSWNLT